MSVIRVEKSRNYSVISNVHLRDRELSLKAKGLLSLILSLPDNWQYSVNGLAAITKEGRTGIMSALRELERAGYLTRHQLRGTRGRMGPNEYVIRELPENRIGWSIRLLLGTGMRTQELLALEPKHVAEDGSLIKIRQAINMDKGKAKIGTPKSEDSYRDVPVPENVRYCVRLLREQAGTYLWEGKPGQVINPKTFRGYFKKALEEVGSVRVLTPHCCRHTYVSQMQALGVDLDTIKSMVGHADIDMTQHYLHVQQPIRQDAIDRFAKAFGGKNPESEPPEPPESGKIIALPIAFSAYNVGG